MLIKSDHIDARTVKMVLDAVLSNKKLKDSVPPSIMALLKEHAGEVSVRF